MTISGRARVKLRFELGAELLGDIGHAGEVGGALHIEPVPQLADAHARLALRHAELVETRGKAGAVEPDQGLAAFGRADAGVDGKRRISTWLSGLPGAAGVTVISCRTGAKPRVRPGKMPENRRPLVVVGVDDFVRGGEESDRGVVPAIDEELLERGLELGEIDRGRLVFLGVVALEPEHDVGHLVRGARRKVGAGDGRHVDDLSLCRAHGEKCCGAAAA